MFTAPTPASDSYPSFGTKTKYQIKSLISIVSHSNTVQILGTTFSNNIGTKGIIYLDIKDDPSNERVIIGGNTFTQNAGYLSSNVIFIRARAPTGKDP
jgi:hypothetical protein